MDLEKRVAELEKEVAELKRGLDARPEMDKQFVENVLMELVQSWAQIRFVAAGDEPDQE